MKNGKSQNLYISRLPKAMIATFIENLNPYKKGQIIVNYNFFWFFT